MPLRNETDQRACSFQVLGTCFFLGSGARAAIAADWTWELANRMEEADAFPSQDPGWLAALDCKFAELTG